MPNESYAFGRLAEVGLDPAEWESTGHCVWAGHGEVLLENFAHRQTGELIRVVAEEYRARWERWSAKRRHQLCPHLRALDGSCDVLQVVPR